MSAVRVTDERLLAVRGAFGLSAWTPTLQGCDGIPAVALTHSWLGHSCPSIFIGVDADATSVLCRRDTDTTPRKASLLCWSSAGCRRYECALSAGMPTLRVRTDRNVRATMAATTPRKASHLRLRGLDFPVQACFVGEDTDAALGVPQVAPHLLHSEREGKAGRAEKRTTPIFRTSLGAKTGTALRGRRGSVGCPRAATRRRR